MPDTPITPKQYAQITAGFARRDEDGRPLRVSDLQLNIVVACESDESGCFDAPFGELLPALRPYRRGTSASRRTYAGTHGGARKRIERHRLFECSRAYTDEHTPSGARKVTPWTMQGLALEGAAPRWSGFGAWSEAVRADDGLIASELVAAFRLGGSLRASGRLSGVTRAGMGELLCVAPQTAMRLLRALDHRGHISLHPEATLQIREGRGRRARLYTIAAHETSVLPSAAEIAAAPREHSDYIAALVADDPSWKAIIAETDAELAAGAFDTCSAEDAEVPIEQPVAPTPEPEPEQEPINPAPIVEPIAPAVIVEPRLPVAVDVAATVLVHPARPPRPTKADAEAVLTAAGAKLWYRPLVCDAVRQARRHRKTDFSAAILLRHFVQPVLDLQERYPAPVVEYALQQTIAKHIADTERYQPWTRYAASICKRKAAQYSGEVKPGTPAAAEAATKNAGRAARDLLGEASALNSRGELVAAHATLDKLLALAPQLAPLFDGDAARAAYQVRLAYKQGGSDLHCARNRYAIDFYQEWTPDGETPTVQLATSSVPAGHARPVEVVTDAEPTHSAVVASSPVSIPVADNQRTEEEHADVVPPVVEQEEARAWVVTELAEQEERADAAHDAATEVAVVAAGAETLDAEPVSDNETAVGPSETPEVCTVCGDPFCEGCER